jgi:hypothetical protein
MPPGERLANPLTERLVAVVRSIGIEVRATTLSHKTFLSGLEIRHSAIPLDEARSRYAGGIVHEAGHLAVAAPAERDAPLRFYGMSCEPRMAASKRVTPFPDMLRWLR